MVEKFLSALRSARVRFAGSDGCPRARRRVSVGAVMAVAGLLVGLLVPVSVAGAQTTTGPSAAVPGPDSPTDFSTVAVSGGARLTWKAPTNTGGSPIVRYEYSYWVHVIGTAEERQKKENETRTSWMIVPGSSRSTTSYTITGLTVGTQYRFAVRAINANGGTGNPTLVIDPVKVTSVPPAPRKLKAKAGDSQVTLSWTRVAAGPEDKNNFNGHSKILRYEYSQKTGSGDWSPWTTMIGSGANFDDFTNGEYNAYKEHVVAGLTNGTSYGFRVRAVNDNGPGAHAEVSGVVVSGVPGRPSGLRAVPASKSVTLSWGVSSDGGSPITSWQYRMKSADSFDNLPAFSYSSRWTTVPGSNAATRSYVKTGLDNDKAYSFQVRAVNKNGQGSSATSPDVTPGDVPGAPTALTGGDVDRNSVTLTWTPPLDPDDTTVVNDGGSPLVRYEYSQKAGDGEWGEWKAIPASGTNSASVTATARQSYKVSGLTAGTGYRFRVRAVNAAGAGGYAEAPQAHYPGTRPLAPTSVTVTPSYDARLGHGKVTLSWVPGSDGGSPVTRWQYKIGTSASGVASSTSWTDICNVETVPTCTSMTSATLPRSLTANGTLPDNLIRYHDNQNLYLMVRALNSFYDEEKPIDTGGLPSAIANGRIEAHVPPTPVRFTHIGYNGAPETSSTLGEFHLFRAILADEVTNREPLIRNEYSFKIDDGPWSIWHHLDGDDGVGLKPFNDLTTKVGTSYGFRWRHVNKLGAGDPHEMEFVWGAPALPGSNGLGVNNFGPFLKVAPGTSQVTLTLQQIVSGQFTDTTTDTDSTKPGNTVWEYSYKVGDGEWGEWTVVNQGIQFAGGQPYVVDGLENGKEYQFRVRGVNDADGPNPLYGSILESILPIAAYERILELPLSTIPVEARKELFKMRRPVVPGVAPPAPLGFSAAGGNQQVMLSWTSGGSGGPPITGWQYCSVPASGTDCDDDGTGWKNVPDSHAGTTSTTIRALDNGTEYTYRVRATNAIGKGAPAEALPVTPGRVPGAPVRALAQAGDSQVTIRVTKPVLPPLSDDDATVRGDRVTGYQVRKKVAGEAYDAWETLGTKIPASANFKTARPSAESGAVVRNLVNGKSYTFQVRARNAYGPGEHVESSAVVPVGPPSAGTLRATAGDGQVVLLWADTGSAGSTITGWEYRQREGDGGYGGWTRISGSSAGTATYTVTGLSNGISYRFEVRAVTSNRQVKGDGFESEVVVPSTVPPQPASVNAARGNTQVTLSWTAGTPGAAGEATWASTTTGWGYRMRTGEGTFGAWTDIDGSDAATTSHVVTGLVNGVVYGFEVRATNAMGPGAAGSASATPATVPSAPTVTATPGDEMVTLSWTAGIDGGSSVTGWQSRTNNGEWTTLAGSGATTAPVQNLTNGVAYTFEVRAVNDVGAGASGTASATPATVPSAPTLTATPGDAMVTLSWTSTGDGESPITAWHLRIDDGEWADLTTMGVGADATGVQVPDLTNGVAYTFGVRAANAMGHGAAATESATPAAVPSAPNVTVTAGDGAIELAWTSTDNGGSPITGWQYRMRVGVGGFGEWTTMGADSTGTSLTGLDSGTGVVVHVFEVRAQNAVGDGAVTTSDEVRPVEASMVGDDYYSGVVDSPNFCARFSLGGARLFALDADGDGVADTCSLPYTRREAIARQNAVVTLANLYPDRYRDLVNAACADLEGDQPCGGETLSVPGYAPPNDGGPYYSGVITGPGYCANASLGGPTTYPLDSDGDGVADICSLPYSRREAIARQMAGDTLAAMHLEQFGEELAEECRRLAASDYGDAPADLANDVCAPRA